MFYNCNNVTIIQHKIIRKTIKKFGHKVGICYKLFSFIYGQDQIKIIFGRYS